MPAKLRGQQVFSFMQSRKARVTVWLSGFMVYLALVCLLVDQSAPRALVAPSLWLLGIWGLGLLVLVLLAPDLIAPRGIRLSVVRAVWLCVGAVVLAVVLPGAARYLMLAVPFIGIAFVSTRLSATEVVAVVLLTWLAYVLAEGWLVYSGVDSLTSAALVLGVFSLSLAAMLSSALEIVGVQQMLNQQRLGMQQHLDQLQVAALQDELTGLYNRRFLMEILSREVAYADREGMALAVCYCDLDHFKQLNDRFGHARGDEALQAFAVLAQSLVRSVDYVSRLGGEEFLLVLVGATAERARRVAQRLCARTREIAVTADASPVRFTVSCGVTQYRPGEGITALLDRADQALYAAKRAGRDRVVVA